MDKDFLKLKYKKFEVKKRQHFRNKNSKCSSESPDAQDYIKFN